MPALSCPPVRSGHDLIKQATFRREQGAGNFRPRGIDRRDMQAKTRPLTGRRITAHHKIPPLERTILLVKPRAAPPESVGLVCQAVGAVYVGVDKEEIDRPAGIGMRTQPLAHRRPAHRMALRKACVQRVMA